MALPSTDPPAVTIPTWSPTASPTASPTSVPTVSTKGPTASPTTPRRRRTPTSWGGAEEGGGIHSDWRRRIAERAATGTFPARLFGRSLSRIPARDLLPRVFPSPDHHACPPWPPRLPDQLAGAHCDQWASPRGSWGCVCTRRDFGHLSGQSLGVDIVVSTNLRNTCWSSYRET